MTYGVGLRLPTALQSIAISIEVVNAYFRRLQ